MKTIVSISLFFFLLVSCDQDNEQKPMICGGNDPTIELGWLKELITKAEIDTIGHYKGIIYLEEYNGRDVFFVEMSMGSGGLAGYWYNCDGSLVDHKGETVIPKRNHIIYKNISL